MAGINAGGKAPQETFMIKGGIEVYINLWQTLKNQKEVLDDTALATLLAGQVHQSVADVLLKWEE